MDKRATAEIIFFGKYHRNLAGLYQLLDASASWRDRTLFVSNDSSFIESQNSETGSIFYLTQEDGHQHTWDAIERAKLIIYEDIEYFSASQQQVRESLGKGSGGLSRSVELQLWHGLPLKDIGRKALLRHTTFDSFVQFNRFLKSSNHFLVPDKEYFSIYREIFTNAQLFVGPEPKWYTYNKTVMAGPSSSRPHQKVLYAPTFREQQKCWDKRSIGLLLEAFEQRNLSLVIRPHIHDFFLKQILCEMKVPYLDAITDIYKVLSDFVGVVTDYSSLLFDCKLLGIPVVSYAFDFEYYLDRHGLLKTPIGGFDQSSFTRTPVETAQKMVDEISRSASSVHKVSAKEGIDMTVLTEFWDKKIRSLIEEK